MTRAALGTPPEVHARHLGTHASHSGSNSPHASHGSHGAHGLPSSSSGLARTGHGHSNTTGTTGHAFEQPKAPNIPYPEFNDFHLKLYNTKVASDQTVDGYAFVSMKDMLNCVKDILIAVRCSFRYYAEDGSLKTVLLHEDIQRNATPFDDDGIPAGDYEFPFSFEIPKNLPYSVTLSGGIEPSLNCKVWYEVRAYIMHAEEHHILDRKHLRTSVRFQRLRAEDMTVELDVSPLKDFSFSKLNVKACLDKNVYHPGDPIKATVQASHDHLRGIYAIKMSARQIVKARKKLAKQYVETTFKNRVATTEAYSKGIPLRRNSTFTRQVELIPTYDEADVSHHYGGIGLAGQVTPNETPHLAPTTVRTTDEGIDVSYAVFIKFSVYLCHDVTISLPFIMADTGKKENIPPRYEEGGYESEAARGKRLEAEESSHWEPQAPMEHEDGKMDMGEDLPPPGYDEVMNEGINGNPLYRVPVPVGQTPDSFSGSFSNRRRSSHRTTIRMRGAQVKGGTDGLARSSVIGSESDKSDMNDMPNRVSALKEIESKGELLPEDWDGTGVITTNNVTEGGVVEATTQQFNQRPPTETIPIHEDKIMEADEAFCTKMTGLRLSPTTGSQRYESPLQSHLEAPSPDGLISNTTFTTAETNMPEIPSCADVSIDPLSLELLNSEVSDGNLRTRPNMSTLSAPMTSGDFQTPYNDNFRNNFNNRRKSRRSTTRTRPRSQSLLSELPRSQSFSTPGFCESDQLHPLDDQHIDNNDTPSSHSVAEWGSLPVSPQPHSLMNSPPSPADDQ
eukprot:Ihof_evm3s2 gene=Ihof_evmTU3s2